MDYESPLARAVAGSIWTGLSRAALGAGSTKTTARWGSLREDRVREVPEGPRFHIFIVGQDRPDAVDQISPVGDSAVPHLYGVVVAVPDRPSPLAGSLLYQGVARLTEGSVKAGFVEPALLHLSPRECESYAKRLLERLHGTGRAT